MSARKSSHCTIFLIVSSGSPLALIASSLRSISKKPFCPMTRSLHPPMTACAHRVRFVGTWREEFFEVPICHSAQLKSDVQDLRLAPYGKRESTFLKNLQHRRIIRKDFSDQFPEPGAKGDRSEMMHERRADTLRLILIDDSESYLRLPRLHEDVTPTPRDHGPAAFLHYRSQRDVIVEVDIQEKVNLRLREAASHSEETAIKGLPAAAIDGCDEVGPVVRSESADFDPPSIAQRLEYRIVGWFQHDRHVFNEPCRWLRAQWRRVRARAATASSTDRGRAQRPLLPLLENKLPIYPSQTTFQPPG